MYTCGPTVYHYVHIGNLRTFTFQDILRRWLRARGYELNHVMNITDVEDKIIRNAMQQQKSLNEYTAVYEKAFLEDAEKLRLEPPERLVRATDHINEMAEAIRILSEKGYTYRSDGSIYYRISKFPEYGKLSHLDISGIMAGARVDVDEYDKADARDFVLWKAPKGEEPFWDTPIGPGRPGWHIECSVMHENEIAQSEAITGRQFVRLWLHSEHLIVEGQKMSKSLGNFFTLRDLLDQGYQPEAIRYLLASVPYRKKLNFTMEGLKAAATAIDRLRNFRLRVQTEKFPDGRSEGIAGRSQAAATRFEPSLDDDLNTAEALAAIFEYIRDANSAMDSGEFKSDNLRDAAAVVDRFDSVFDVLRPTVQESGIRDSEVEELIAERQNARKTRNFRRADEIRDELLQRGVILEDTKEGVRWKRK
jgi:cysteinyl-tRNA synthetase